MSTAMEQMDLRQQKKGRMIFFMMAIFFIVPIVVVVVMIKMNWRPSGQSFGELVNPPRMIMGDDNIKDVNGNLKAKFWTEKWSIVFLTNHCEKTCFDKLHDMRQIYVSTYKDMIRVQRVLITTQKDVSDIQKQYPDMLIINQPAESVEALSTVFNVSGEQAIHSNRTYLVDPLGNVMMSYPASSPATHIRKDLVRLLKYSWAA